LGVGGVTSIYGPGTALYVANNITSNGNVIVKNSIVAANATINANVVVVGTANIGYLGVANSVLVGTTLTVGSNTTSGNLNTTGMVYAGTLRTTGRADVGGDAAVAGSLTVNGNFVLSGDIVYDTNLITISSDVAVSTTGAGYFGVFRGNTSGGVAGANVNSLGTVSDANAYIRWSASANNWQIRDIFNGDNDTSYSKILTANLISDSLSSSSTDTFLSSNGAKTLDLAYKANVGSGLISTKAAYEANVGSALITAKAFSANADNISSGTMNVARLGTSSNAQFNSIGVGTSASTTTGEIRATNNITAYYSDDRLKTNLGNISDALQKLLTLNGFHYQANEVAVALGYKVKPEVGVSAQQVQKVLPEIVVPAPIDDKYLTVHYEKLIPLLIEAIKELNDKVEKLEKNK